MPRHRPLLIAFFSAITIVGVFAGIKIAQFEERGRSAPRSLAPVAQRDRTATLTTDGSFYAPSASTTPIARKNPPKPTPVTAPATEPAAQAVPADQVQAESYLVGNVETGQIYFSKNDSTVLPFASMSKLITALVATDQYPATTTITITPLETDVPPDPSGLKAGETFTLKELLEPMLLDSSNVAAEAIASSSDRAHFLDLMSGYAWEIGMSDSYFADPTGLSSHNAGTALGFFRMAQYLYKSRPDILAITRTVEDSVATTSEHGAHVFASIHPFVRDPRFIGGKTGFTYAAEDTMLTIMKIDGQPIAFIVLRSPGRRQEDTQLLIDRISAKLAAR